MSSCITTYQDEEASQIWEMRFNELVHYQKGHGHCRVPTDSGVLGKWVMHLREKYKRCQQEGGRYRGQLTQERIARLNNIGFEWSIRPPTTPWETRYQQLEAFHQEHSHTKVTKSNCNDDLSFAEWVQKQRKLLRNGKLSQERVDLLKSIGFEERLVATNKTWEESFAMLLEFRRHHGHARVPKPTSNTAEDDHALRVWADRQRTYYHAYYLKKKTCILTKKRIKQLENIGFEWGSYRGSSTWNLRYQQLLQFAREYGHLNVPTSHKPLGRWVSEQRSHYNKMMRGAKSSMTRERQLALERIGFQWSKPTKKNIGQKASKTDTTAQVASLEPDIAGTPFENSVDEDPDAVKNRVSV